MAEEKKTLKSKAKPAGKAAEKAAEKAMPEKVVEPKKQDKKATSKKEDCGDVNCPVHGSLSTRGQILEGIVVSDKMRGTVIVQRDYYVKLKKYDRYKRSTSRIAAHNPPCLNAKNGDNVRIMECRKISKTVSFVVIEKS